MVVPSHLHTSKSTTRYWIKQGHIRQEWTPASEYATFSVVELESLVGINFFPRMSATAKKDKLELPKPSGRGDRMDRKC